jgi:hypothetical protein
MADCRPVPNELLVQTSRVLHADSYYGNTMAIVAEVLLVLAKTAVDPRADPWMKSAYTLLICTDAILTSKP